MTVIRLGGVVVICAWCDPGELWEESVVDDVVVFGTVIGVSCVEGEESLSECVSLELRECL